MIPALSASMKERTGIPATAMGAALRKVGQGAESADRDRPKENGDTEYPRRFPILLHLRIERLKTIK